MCGLGQVQSWPHVVSPRDQDADNRESLSPEPHTHMTSPMAEVLQQIFLVSLRLNDPIRTSEPLPTDLEPYTLLSLDSSTLNPQL